MGSMSGGFSRAQNRVFNIFGPQRYECLISLFNARTRRDELNSVSGLIITRKSVHWTTECLYDFDHADQSTYLILHTDDTTAGTNSITYVCVRVFDVYNTYKVCVTRTRINSVPNYPYTRAHTITRASSHSAAAAAWADAVGLKNRG